jgi:hypothetical protein
MMHKILLLFALWNGTSDAFLASSPVLHHRYRNCIHTNSASVSNARLPWKSRERIIQKSSVSDEVSWKVGNVYEDLDSLEAAINMANAEENLKQVERVEMLQHFAQARRPLLPDVQKFLVAPLALALVFRFLAQSNATTKLFARVLTRLLDIHFWSFVVAMPMVLLAAKRISMPPSEPMPEELKDLDPEYLPFVTTDWEPPGRSCSDHVLFLLEYWSSAVAGMAIIGILQTVVKFPGGPAGSLWRNGAQLLTRTAALASLYQYPKQMFQLQRSQQPRPVGFIPMLMQSLVRGMLIAAPLGLASDLSKVLGHLQRGSLVALYTSISALFLGTSLRMQHADILSFRKLERPSVAKRLLYTAAYTAFWKKPLANLGRQLEAVPFQRLIREREPMKVALACSSLLFIGLTPILM